MVSTVSNQLIVYSYIFYIYIIFIDTYKSQPIFNLYPQTLGKKNTSKVNKKSSSQPCVKDTKASNRTSSTSDFQLQPKPFYF